MPDPKIDRDEDNLKALIKALNEDLAREYQAIIAYTVYSNVLTGAQWMQIAAELKKHAAEELEHAMIIADQIDYLGGMPTATPKEVKLSDKPEEMIRFDLDNETETIRNYRERVQQAEALGHYALAEQLAESSPRSRSISTIWPPRWGSTCPRCSPWAPEAGERIKCRLTKGILAQAGDAWCCVCQPTCAVCDTRNGMYKRIVLKLSGEALAGPRGLVSTPTKWPRSPAKLPTSTRWAWKSPWSSAEAISSAAWPTRPGRWTA